jgi:four helix bundle protein
MATVLVIDDDEDVTQLLDTQLSDEGHDVIIAHQGDDGLNKAMQLRPDLIMLDVFLPDSTGFQICSQLRKNTTTQSIPIIMMTGAARFPSQQLFGLERGANEYIAKPFDIVEVSQLVHKHLSGHATVSVSAPAASATLTLGGTSMEQPLMNKRPQHTDDLSALNSFLQQSIKRAPFTQPEPAVELKAEIEPFKILTTSPKDEIMASLSTPSKKKSGPVVQMPVIPINEPTRPAPVAAQPVAMPQPIPVQEHAPAPVTPMAQPTQSQGFTPGVMASRERFVDFSLEIFALASRLSSTHAERYLSEQLLRSSMSVASKLGEMRFAPSKAEFMAMLHDAMKDLRETGYWLMLARKANLLEVCSRGDLEKTCQSLMTLLNDFLASEKKRLSLA